MEFIDLPNVEDFETRKEWEAAAWRHFITWCAKRDPKVLHGILESVTSSHERRLMIKRAAVMARIRAGASYREIGRELWLSPQTISAIKKGLTARSYASNWEKAKSLKRARELARWKKSAERPLPKRYRRTKYGRMRIW